jgi:hypothetical protein
LRTGEAARTRRHTLGERLSPAARLFHNYRHDGDRRLEQLDDHSP